MGLRIRLVQTDDIESLVRLSLAAWAPVFRSFEQILGHTIYARLYPDWEASQRSAVEGVCSGVEQTTVWVADLDGVVAGFIACSMDAEAAVGEVQLLAVHPDQQGHGVGTELNTFALGEMTARGMRLAVASTGGDPSHAPARRSYEKAGYVGLPLVRYYKDL